MDWDSLEWAEIFRRLVLFAFRRGQLRGVSSSLADAEDIPAEAIRRLLDSDYAHWDSGRQPDLLRHLGSTVNGLISNGSRTARLRVEHSLSDPSILQRVEQSMASNDEIDQVEECQRALLLLDRRVADDELIRKLLSLEKEGITKPAMQATRLKLAISVIYQARRRLTRHREAVRREVASEALSRNGLHQGQNWTRS